MSNKVDRIYALELKKEIDRVINHYKKPVLNDFWRKVQNNLSKGELFFVIYGKFTGEVHSSYWKEKTAWIKSYGFNEVMGQLDWKRQANFLSNLQTIELFEGTLNDQLVHYNSKTE